jgi:hypothetical protein
MSVVPTAHAASHAAGGNDAIAQVNLTAGLILTEQEVPATPAAGTCILYAVVDGAGTSLSVKFDDGTVVELADNV